MRGGGLLFDNLCVRWGDREFLSMYTVSCVRVGRGDFVDNLM
jgi:hypothetical protein